MNYFEYSGDQVFDEGKKTKLNWPSSRYQRNGEWAGWSESFITDWGVGNYRLDFYAGDKMFYMKFLLLVDHGAIMHLCMLHKCIIATWYTSNKNLICFCIWVITNYFS